MNATKVSTNGLDHLTEMSQNDCEHLSDSPYQSTGLVLFNTTGQLLFMNREAQLYLPQLILCATRENGASLIPEDVLIVVRELIGRVLFCKHPKDLEAIQVERLCSASDQRFLLRGLCAPDVQLHRSQLLVVIEKLNQTLRCPDAKIQQLYHLTEREQMVIIYIMLGFTNKEIANRLNLSEYTVKEHIKRVMHKTKTNTRTGLLARICFSFDHKDLSLSHPEE